MNEKEKISNETNIAEDSFFVRLKSGLDKTRNNLTDGIKSILKSSTKVGPDLLEELEEVLLRADIGFSTMNWVMDELKKEVKKTSVGAKEEIISHLKQILMRALDVVEVQEVSAVKGPHVVLIVGINGSGKTTTIGKLAARYKEEGEKVIVAAGDTFRAAATEQLQVWAERIGVLCVSQKSGADPSAVAYDAMQSAVVKKADRVLVDTAGRLQTNKNLMEELKKIKRVIGNVIEGAPHETILVLDASIGQNSISQAKLFDDALDVDGIIMTKLDGSAKGGVLFNITHQLQLPVRFIGVGEKIDDLQLFNAKSFVEALFHT